MSDPGLRYEVLIWPTSQIGIYVGVWAKVDYGRQSRRTMLAERCTNMCVVSSTFG